MARQVTLNLIFGGAQESSQVTNLGKKLSFFGQFWGNLLSKACLVLLNGHIMVVVYQ